MQRVNIICRDNGAGLSRHIDILYGLLSGAGMRVTVSRISAPRLRGAVRRAAVESVRRIGNRLNVAIRRATARRFDINLFIEAIYPEWLPCARTNCLIPNQEWFRDEYLPWLPEIDLLLCQTQHALQVFGSMGCPVEYISFTSHDRYSSDCARHPQSVLHVAGSSLEKGTQVLLDVWSRHPDWPTLTVIQRCSRTASIGIPNVQYVTRYLSDTDLRQIQNASTIHICPSEVESFGHTIVEGMSVKALTVVTDAPPMNEMASEDRSLLVDYSHTEPLRRGMKYFAAPASLEARIEEALLMDDSGRNAMGEKARAWFRQNDAFFRRRAVEVIAGL